MNQVRNYTNLKFAVLIFFGVLACNQVQRLIEAPDLTPTALPTSTIIKTPTTAPLPTFTKRPRPTASITPPTPLSNSLLTLPELNSIFNEINKTVWQRKAAPEHLQLIPNITANAEGAMEQASSSWVGTMLLGDDSVIQIYMQKWATKDATVSAVALYKSAHDVNYELTKNSPGVFITSSKTIELINGEIIEDLLGIDQLNPIVYTAVVHYSNISFTIQSVFPNIYATYTGVMRKYVSAQMKKLHESGYK